MHIYMYVLYIHVRVWQPPPPPLSIILRKDDDFYHLPIVCTLIIHSYKAPTVQHRFRTTILFIIEIYITSILSVVCHCLPRGATSIRKFFGSVWNWTQDFWHSNLVRCLLCHARTQVCVTWCSLKHFFHISHELCDNPRERTHETTCIIQNVNAITVVMLENLHHTFHSYWAILCISWIFPETRVALFSGLDCTSDFPELYNEQKRELLIYSEIIQTNWK